MEAVAGCFVLSVIYLSCDINPLQIGSYPNVQYVTFSQSGSAEAIPRSLFYQQEDWPFLKSVNLGEHVYVCGKNGQCLLMDYAKSGSEQEVNPRSGALEPSIHHIPISTIKPTLESSEDKFAPIKPGSVPKELPLASPTTGAISRLPARKLHSTIKPTSQQSRSGVLDPSKQHHSNGQLLTVIMTSSIKSTVEPANEDRDKLNAINPQSEVFTIKPTPQHLNDELKTTYHSKLPPTIKPTGFKQQLAETFSKSFNDIKNAVKEYMKNELEKHLDTIKDLVIGFSSSFISISVVGGSIVIGVKLHKKRARTMTVPHHLYLPFHTPSTVGRQLMGCESNEDFDELDFQGQGQGTKNISPSAPLKEPTPLREEYNLENETVVKQLFPSQVQERAKSPKMSQKSSKNKVRRSQSDEGSFLRSYDLRPRTDNKTEKNVMSTAV